MKLNSVVFTLASLLSLGEAKKFNFNVISIKGDSVTLGVKFDNRVVSLTASNFPVFTGSVEAENITKFKYVALDENGQQLDEETIERTYSESSIKDVYNRQPKDVKIPKLEEPFKRQFSMGSDKFLPFPDDVIYNVYAKCDDSAYTDLSSQPFIGSNVNENMANCTFHIVTPINEYNSKGSIHVLGYGSRTYKKLSWGFKFDKKILGRKAVKLRAMAIDPTLIREKLSTAIYKAVGVPVQEGAYARLIINNDVYGLYLINDSLSSKWISNYIHGDNDAKIGNSYKLCSSHPNGPFNDFKYLGEDYQAYKSDGTYKSDEFDEEEVATQGEAAIWKNLIEFTKLYQDWVEQYGNDDSDKAIEELKKFLNIESLLRLLVVDSLILALDNFYLYQSNAALYYNPQRKNYQIIPYDFDQTLYGTKDKPDLDDEKTMEDCITWVNYSDNEVFDHSFTKNLLKHPQIKERYDVIMAKTLAGPFDDKKIHNYVHALADLIRDDVAWNFALIDELNIGYETSNGRGNINHYTLENFEGNIDYEKVSFDGNSFDDAEYGLQTFVELRGGYCRNYTASVDASDNSNISDDYNDVKIPKGSSKRVKVLTSGSISSYSSSLTVLFIISQFILFFLL